MADDHFSFLYYRYCASLAPSENVQVSNFLGQSAPCRGMPTPLRFHKCYFCFSPKLIFCKTSNLEPRHTKSSQKRKLSSLLAPASEGWGKVLFSICQFTPRRGWGVPHLADWGGYPTPDMDGGVPHPRSRGGPHPAYRGSTPISGLDRGVTHPTDGGYPHPRSGQGVPQGPHQDWMGVSPHQDWMGVPLVQDWMGYPLPRSGDRSA